MLDPNMRLRPIQMKSLLFSCLASALVAIFPTPPVMAWGPVGHAEVGRAAVAALDAAPRARLATILQTSSEDAMEAAVDEACYWPDTVRDSPGWSWSSPLHYVNIPRSSHRYDRQRDCPEGLCVTEGILRYAAELGRPGLDKERRWQAFAFLCHLVGDLHQPLHAGFRDDRGGNLVEIEYHGTHDNLHRFWDSMLVGERLAGGAHVAIIVGLGSDVVSRPGWNPADVVRWTEESHSLAASRAYPSDTVIDDAFADESWRLIQDQWLRAATRLALILNDVLATE